MGHWAIPRSRFVAGFGIRAFLRSKRGKRNKTSEIQDEKQEAVRMDSRDRDANCA